MTRRSNRKTLSFLAALAGLSVVSSACQFKNTRNPLLPTGASSVAQPDSSSTDVSSQPPATSSGPSSSLVDVWNSQALTAPSPASCADFQWAITGQSATSVNGTFSAQCANGIAVTGTASGELRDSTNVAITVSGTAIIGNILTCPFSATSNATIEDSGNALRIPYTGTTCLGPVSGTETLHRRQQAAPEPPAPPPADPGSSNGWSDAIDLSAARVYNSPADIASWPVTVRIDSLTMRPLGAPDSGVALGFNSNWPDWTPPGWAGPIQYTVWAVVNINGQWHTSGFIEMWRGRENTGAPILSDFARNWAYDSRWGPMAGYQPHAGEEMGFFVSAGDARGYSGVTSVRERSNVVVIPLPAGDNGSFGF